MAKKEAVIEELLQFLTQNVQGFTRPEVGSHEYVIIDGYAADITSVRNSSEASHVKEFLSRGIKLELRNTLTPPQHRRTPSHPTFYPGRDSIFGFMGWGESLTAVLADDAKTLRRLNRTAKDIGAKLKQVLDSPPRGFKVRTISSNNGNQPCPFAGHRNDLILHADKDYSIMRGRQGIVVPGLAWHLIGEHSFFEGKFTEYRVDPARLVKVLFG